jgi:hypothetical protein
VLVHYPGRDRTAAFWLCNRSARSYKRPNKVTLHPCARSKCTASFMRGSCTHRRSPLETARRECVSLGSATRRCALANRLPSPVGHRRFSFESQLTKRRFPHRAVTAHALCKRWTAACGGGHYPGRILAERSQLANGSTRSGGLQSHRSHGDGLRLNCTRFVAVLRGRGGACIAPGATDESAGGVGAVGNAGAVAFSSLA